jgi:glycosyltransferase 2 family protein
MTARAGAHAGCRARWLQVAALVLGVGVLAALCRVFGARALAASLRGLQPRYLVVSVALGVAARFCYALRWLIVARTLGAAAPLRQLAAARLAGDAVGALLPGGRIGGDPVRIAWVQGAGLAGIPAGAGVTIDRIMETAGNALFAMMSVSVFAVVRTTGAAQRAAVLSLALLGVLLLGLALPLEMLRRGKRPLRPVCGVVARWRGPRAARVLAVLQHTEELLLQFFRDRAGVFGAGLLFSLGIEGALVGECHFLLRAFGVTLDLPTLFMVLVTTGVARVVPTPAGIGAMEAGEVALLGASAGLPGVGFIVGIALRLQETAWCAVGLALWVLRGLSRARPRLRPSLWGAAP